MANDGLYYAAVGQSERLMNELAAAKKAIEELRQAVYQKSRAEVVQEQLKIEALEQLKKFDPNNKLLDPDYRTDLAKKMREQYDREQAAIKEAEARAQQQNGKKGIFKKIFG